MSARPWIKRARARSTPPRLLRGQVEREPSPIEILEEAERPRTRGDCKGGLRPCPWVSCRHHLLIEVGAESGSLKLNFGHEDPDLLDETCSLDVADRGGSSLEEVGQLLNVVRERIRQIEVHALIAVRSNGKGEL